MSNILFIAPHPDDIAYSCFIAANLNVKNKHLLTVFGKSCYGYQSTNNNVDIISRIRKFEDSLFAELIHARFDYNEFEDSSITFNNRPYSLSSYPNVDNIERLLQNTINRQSFSHVFFPAGLGWHYDHRIVSDIIVTQILPLFYHSVKFIAYEDLPYVIDLTNNEIDKRISDLLTVHPIHQVKRLNIRGGSLRLQKEAIKKYSSQYEKPLVDKILNYKSWHNHTQENLWVIETI